MKKLQLLLLLSLACFTIQLVIFRYNFALIISYLPE